MDIVTMALKSDYSSKIFQLDISMNLNKYFGWHGRWYVITVV